MKRLRTRLLAQVWSFVSWPFRFANWRLIFILLLVAGSLLTVWPGGPDLDVWVLGRHITRAFPVTLGLDLQGGSELIYEADMTSIAEDNKADALASVRGVIERRVNGLGVTEPLVQTSKVGEKHRIIVALAGIHDVNAAVKAIGETPVLDFRELAAIPAKDVKPDDIVAVEPPAELTAETPITIYKPTGLSGKQLARAFVEFNPNTSEPEVGLQFNSEGAKLFGGITTRNVGKQVAIFLDGEPISAPVVQSAITEGRAVISGNFTIMGARELAQRLNAGALPVPITLVSQHTVGSTLGREALSGSVFAGLTGLIAVMLFMVLVYRVPGVVASISLLIYALITFALFKLIPVTLTLAGIAGFILSIGAAVDANILIFERMKEELRRGLPIMSAIGSGFIHAWASIRDSNMSSLITSFVLAWFGSSLIRGFAITLMIGILINMFVAFVISRQLLTLVLGAPWLRSKKLFGNV